VRRFRRGIAEQQIEDRIRHVLADMRPLLRIDSVAVELVRYDSAARVAHLRVGGGCPDCDMTAAALTQAIEAHLRRRVPEVETVAAESPHGS
jgi:Fe-S cluster biogenesis protein NfuA